MGPWQRHFTHRLGQPDRAEWLAALHLAGTRADRFAFCWMEEPPAASGWRSNYGGERLRPMATETGPAGFPVNALNIVGPVTPELLEIVAGEPPHGLIGPERYGPGWRSGALSPSPWWCLMLLVGDEVIVESRENGDFVFLTISPDEAARLDSSGGRLHKLALQPSRHRPSQ